MMNKRISAVSFKLAAVVSATTAFQLPTNSLLSQNIALSYISTTPKHDNRHNRRHDTTTRLHVSWSNGQAIQEYQDFLSGKSNSNSDDVNNDGPSVIIASPEFDYPLVNTLLSLGNGDDIVIGPNEPLPTHVEQRDKFPIYVALPPPLLSSALSQNLLSNWDDKREDLVFFTVDKGCVEDILKTYGLMRDATTQVLTSFTTHNTPPSYPAQPPTIHDLSVRFGSDANGDEKAAMETVTCGKWRDAIAQRLEKSNSFASPIRRSFHREWRRHMWEKTTFDACFNLVGAVRDTPTSIKDVALYYGDEVAEMAWQLSGLLRGAMAVTLTYGFEERMFEYAERRGGDVMCLVSDETFPFTNGLFWEYSAKGLRAGFGDPAPMHTEYLGYAVQARGLIRGVEMGEVDVEQTRMTIMRQGNLRADGAI